MQATDQRLACDRSRYRVRQDTQHQECPTSACQKQQTKKEELWVAQNQVMYNRQVHYKEFSNYGVIHFIFTGKRVFVKGLTFLLIFIIFLTINLPRWKNFY